MKRHSEQMLTNLGYRFEAAAWGKGYATELAKFLIRYGFTELSLREISVTTKANHLASPHVLKKSGLRYIRDIHDATGAPSSLLFILMQKAWLNEHWYGE